MIYFNVLNILEYITMSFRFFLVYYSSTFRAALSRFYRLGSGLLASISCCEEQAVSQVYRTLGPRARVPGLKFMLPSTLN